MSVAITNITYDKEKDRLSIRMSGDSAELRKIENTTKTLLQIKYGQPPFKADNKQGAFMFSSRDPDYFEVSLENVTKHFPKACTMLEFETPEFQAVTWYLLRFLRDVNGDYQGAHTLGSIKVEYPLLTVKPDTSVNYDIPSAEVHITPPPGTPTSVALAEVMAFKYEAVRQDQRTQFAASVDGGPSKVLLLKDAIPNYAKPDKIDLDKRRLIELLPFSKTTVLDDTTEIKTTIRSLHTFNPGTKDKAAAAAKSFADQVGKMFGVHDINSPARRP